MLTVPVILAALRETDVTCASTAFSTASVPLPGDRRHRRADCDPGRCLLQSAHDGTPAARVLRIPAAGRKGAVAKVTFGEREIDVTLRDGQTRQTVAPPEFLSANSSFITDLVKHGVRVEVEPVADPQALSYGMIATVAAFFGLIGFTVYRTTAGRIPNSGRTRVAERGD